MRKLLIGLLCVVLAAGLAGCRERGLYVSPDKQAHDYCVGHGGVKSVVPSPGHGWSAFTCTDGSNGSADFDVSDSTFYPAANTQPPSKE